MKAKSARQPTCAESNSATLTEFFRFIANVIDEKATKIRR